MGKHLSYSKTEWIHAQNNHEFGYTNTKQNKTQSGTTKHMPTTTKPVAKNGYPSIFMVPEHVK